MRAVTIAMLLVLVSGCLHEDTLPPVCDPNSGSCSTPSGCSHDGDCPGTGAGYGYKCLFGDCVSCDCSDKYDCDYKSGIERSCEDCMCRFEQCFDDYDCGYQERCENNICDEKECVENYHCDFEDKCVDYQCVPE